MDLAFWLPLVINFFVALGTILLAAFAFYTSVQSRKQAEELEKMQTARLNLDSPVLRIEKFEFDEKLYAIQVRRVKQEYTEFLIMTLDMDKLGDITAYNIDNSFSLRNLKYSGIFTVFK